VASDTAFEAAARSWVEHLRAGGTTPWADWATVAALPDSPTSPGVPLRSAARPGAPLPGAAQLELLRRLNQAGPLPQLADHVLTRPGPGRGWVHLPLPWPPARPTAPAPEVRRVAVGVLADLTARLGGPEERKGRWTRRARRPRSTGKAPTFALEGLPLTVAALRERLASAGLVEHRQRIPWYSLRARTDDLPDRVLIVAGPVDEALSEVWARRVLDGAHRSWRGFLSTWSSRDALPPSVNLELALGHWLPKVGPDRVHVVVAPREDPDALTDRIGDLLGHRPEDLAPCGVAPRPVLVDLLRRVDEVLPFLLPEDRRAGARAALSSLMREERHGPRWVGLPRTRRAWATRCGVRLTEAVRASGATVHGDLEVLASLSPSARGVRAVDTVAAAVRMIHRIEESGPGTGSAGGGTSK
jgi:hypothetical protein